MKEKRIDMYLSVASLFHLLVVGAGGAFFAEYFVDKPRSTVLEVTFISTFVGFLALTVVYSKIIRITRKKKWES